jgi:hypothetical protein
VAHPDQPDAGRPRALDHRGDVAAGQEEQVVDPTRLQRGCHRDTPVVLRDRLVPAISPTQERVGHDRGR